MTSLTLALPEGEYKITIGQGLLSDTGKYFDLNRKCLIVTDDGVPEEYSTAVAKSCKDATVHTIKSGEASKNIDTLSEILKAMLEFQMTRKDAVIAVGGGVVGDISGLAASLYMRGVDFYNVPTTLLSQLDSSIGGKTAIDFMGVKNVVGAFYQPKGVLIDTETLNTLDKRQYSAGMAEAIKMALTSNESLLSYIEENDINESNIETVITESLKIKKAVVEEDERESGIRKILNLGHTLGHGIEAATDGKLLHGECVAIGMIPVCEKEIRERLYKLLKKFDLPTKSPVSIDEAFSFVAHDKKADGNGISVILVNKAGTHEIKKMTVSEFKNLVEENLK